MKLKRLALFIPMSAILIFVAIKLPLYDHTAVDGNKGVGIPLPHTIIPGGCCAPSPSQTGCGSCGSPTFNLAFYILDIALVFVISIFVFLLVNLLIGKTRKFRHNADSLVQPQETPRISPQDASLKERFIRKPTFRKTFVVLLLIVGLVGAYLFYENSLTQYYHLPSLSFPAVGGKRIVDFDKAFILRKDEIAFVRNADISLKITGFVYSPCPEGFQCFWSGLDVHYELTVDGQAYVHPGTAQNAPYYVWIKQSDYKTYAKFVISQKTSKELLERRPTDETTTETTPETTDDNNTWALVFQNSGFPPNDKFVEGFYAYDMLTKYYKYPKGNIRFITTQNEVSDKWLALGGIEVFNAYNDSAITSMADDIYSQPTKQSYVEAVNWLQENSTKEDDVLIFSFTHGGSSPKGENFDTDIEYDNDDEYFLLGNQATGEVENFYDGELADLVTGIEAKNMFIWISACHGGGFAWDIIDRVEKSGNIENLYFMTPAIDERDLVLVNISSVDYSEIDFDWPDLGEGNFFGFFVNGLTGLKEEYDNTSGNLVLKVNQPKDRNIDFALEEAKNCKIDTTDAPATIGLLDFIEGSKFSMKPALGCSWSEGSKTSEYPDGEATLGYMKREDMDFVFRVSSY